MSWPGPPHATRASARPAGSGAAAAAGRCARPAPAAAPAARPRIRLSRPCRTSAWVSTCASSMTTTSWAADSGTALNSVWTRSMAAPRGIATGAAMLRAVALPEGRHEQAPEPRRLGVRSRRVEPGHPGAAAPDPVGEQHGLAGPRTGRQQGERRVRGVIQFSEQARARDVPRGQLGHDQTGVTHRVRYGPAPVARIQPRRRLSEQVGHLLSSALSRHTIWSSSSSAAATS